MTQATITTINSTEIEKPTRQQLIERLRKEMEVFEAGYRNGYDNGINDAYYFSITDFNKLYDWFDVYATDEIEVKIKRDNYVEVYYSLPHNKMGQVPDNPLEKEAYLEGWVNAVVGFWNEIKNELYK